MHTILLGSSSPSRKQLLLDAKISFRVIGHSADEAACDWALPLPELVTSIALSKMEHVVLRPGNEGGYCFVLTADTLSQDSHGVISGKPVDRQEAKKMLVAARDGMYTGTAFCLDKRVWRSGSWQIDTRIVRFVGAHYTFNVPDAWIETYLDKGIGISTSAAIAVEGYGGLFLHEVQGSYTTIVGLPLFELREALSEVHFFSV